MWVVPRDEAMFGWFQIVRIADVQAVRWVLGALNGAERPVSVRRAQSWCARMESVGLVERAQLGGRGGALVWATYASTGQAAPNLYRQTTRHEVAVATTSARYAAAGYAWQRDDKPTHAGGHQADGVALARDWVELIEVELTPKRMPRYGSIFTAYRRRLERGDADQITYLCTADAARAVETALHALLPGRSIAPQVEVHVVFGPSGDWTDEALPRWMLSVRERARRGTARVARERPVDALF